MQRTRIPGLPDPGWPGREPISWRRHMEPTRQELISQGLPPRFPAVAEDEDEESDGSAEGHDDGKADETGLPGTGGTLGQESTPQQEYALSPSGLAPAAVDDTDDTYKLPEILSFKFTTPGHDIIEIEVPRKCIGTDLSLIHI